jgi:hypothetical protein
MRWLFPIGLTGAGVAGLSCAWLLLLAYPIVGKPDGQDPRFDAAIEYWSGPSKAVGVLGILSVIFQVIAMVAGWL